MRWASTRPSPGKLPSCVGERQLQFTAFGVVYYTATGICASSPPRMTGLWLVEPETKDHRRADMKPWPCKLLSCPVAKGNQLQSCWEKFCDSSQNQHKTTASASLTSDVTTTPCNSLTTFYCGLCLLSESYHYKCSECLLPLT